MKRLRSFWVGLLCCVTFVSLPLRAIAREPNPYCPYCGAPTVWSCSMYPSLTFIANVAPDGICFGSTYTQTAYVS